jgi:hypothetical protein
VPDSGSGGEYASWDADELVKYRRARRKDLRKPLPKQFDPDSDIKGRWQGMIDQITAELDFRAGRNRSNR